ncbi:MAG: hypothetical protein ACFCD0_04010 [Gemmataceae bacterium]
MKAPDLPWSIYVELPVVLVLISLVYSATRYEAWPSILAETVRWTWRMFAFLFGIGGALYLVMLYLDHYWTFLRVFGVLLVLAFLLGVGWLAFRFRDKIWTTGKQE